MECIACECLRHEIIIEIHLSNLDYIWMWNKHRDTCNTLDDLDFVWIISSADFCNRFV